MTVRQHAEKATDTVASSDTESYTLHPLGAETKKALSHVAFSIVTEYAHWGVMRLTQVAVPDSVIDKVIHTPAEAAR